MTQVIINGVSRTFDIDKETFEVLRLALIEKEDSKYEDPWDIPEFIEITTIEGDKCIINTHAITFVG